MNYQQAYELCTQKLEQHMRWIPKENPEFCACSDGQYFRNEHPLDFMDIQTWMPSFFTGEVLLAYEYSKDKRYLDWLEQFEKVYEEKVFLHPEQTMHDLGFLYLPYAVGLWNVTKKKSYRDMALKAADELAKRFSVKGGFIRAWGKNGDMQDPRAGEAIIDCMMNIPLLFWASKETGIPIYEEIAKRHADTTFHYFMREDGSLYHAYRFDVHTGEPMWGCNYCGYSDESFWARGCAWAIYGFVIAYTYTGKQRYLDISVRLLKRFQKECENEEDGIPLWDFRLPFGIQERKDTSAAAIVASAAYELAECTSDREYRDYAEKLLHTLMKKQYFDQDVNVPGILRESNGLGHYTLFGDFFFMEALMKAMNGVGSDIIWKGLQE